MGIRMHTYTSKTLEKNKLIQAFTWIHSLLLWLLKVGQKIKTSLTTTKKARGPPTHWGLGRGGHPQNEILIQGLKRQDKLGCKCNHLSLKAKVYWPFSLLRMNLQFKVKTQTFYHNYLCLNYIFIQNFRLLIDSYLTCHEA